MGSRSSDDTGFLVESLSTDFRGCWLHSVHASELRPLCAICIPNLEHVELFLDGDAHSDLRGAPLQVVEGVREFAMPFV